MALPIGNLTIIHVVFYSNSGDHAGQFWHSTAISVRIKPRLLATKSGTLYRLSGKMDRTLAMEQGKICPLPVHIREFSFLMTDGFAMVSSFQPNVVVFSTMQIHPIIVVEIEGRPSSKPLHVQMMQNVVITITEPSVVKNESSLMSLIPQTDTLVQCTSQKYQSRKTKF